MCIKAWLMMELHEEIVVPPNFLFQAEHEYICRKYQLPKKKSQKSSKSRHSIYFSLWRNIYTQYVLFLRNTVQFVLYCLSVRCAAFMCCQSSWRRRWLCVYSVRFCRRQVSQPWVFSTSCEKATAGSLGIAHRELTANGDPVYFYWKEAEMGLIPGPLLLSNCKASMREDIDLLLMKSN